MNHYRRFEECLNHLFQSCIPNSSVYILSFAHNEDCHSQELKYDVHVNDLGAAKVFLSNLSKVFKKMADLSNRVFSSNYELSMKAVSFMENLFDYVSSSHLPSIYSDDFSLCFSFYPWYEEATDNSPAGSETGYTAFFSQFNPERETQFVNIYCKAFDWTPSVSEEADARVYKDPDWCWGRRFSITHDGVKYVGENI